MQPRLLDMRLLLTVACGFSATALALGSSQKASPSLAAVPDSTELICHTDDPAECYPRIFEATHEFQTVHADQDLPPGLHVRLNVWTGEKEAKIYNASEEDAAELQGLAVDQSVLVVDQPAGEGDDALADGLPRGAPAYDPVGKVKEPAAGGGDEAAAFAAALGIVKGVGLQYERDHGVVAEAERAHFADALEQLDEFAHDMYYGSRLAEDGEAARILLCLMTAAEADDNTVDTTSQQAAAIMAAAVQNNPAALRALEGDWGSHQAAVCRDGQALGGRMFASLAAAGSRSPAWLRSRLSAINGLLKSEAIMQDFLQSGGLVEMQRLLVTADSDDDGLDAARARAANLVMDNFLNVDMGADVTLWPAQAAGQGAAECRPNDVHAACWGYHAQRLAEAHGASADGSTHWTGELWRLVKQRQDEQARDEL